METLLNCKTRHQRNSKEEKHLVWQTFLDSTQFNLCSWAQSGCTPACFSCCTGSPGPVYCGPASYVCCPVGLSPRQERVEEGGSAGSQAQVERGPVLPSLWCWEGEEIFGSCRSLSLWRGLWVCWGTGWRESCAWGWVCCHWPGWVSGLWGSGLSWGCRGTCSVCGHTTPTLGTWRRPHWCWTSWCPPRWPCSTRCPSADRRSVIVDQEPGCDCCPR